MNTILAMGTVEKVSELNNFSGWALVIALGTFIASTGLYFLILNRKKEEDAILEMKMGFSIMLGVLTALAAFIFTQANNNNEVEIYEISGNITAVEQNPDNTSQYYVFFDNEKDTNVLVNQYLGENDFNGEEVLLTDCVKKTDTTPFSYLCENTEFVN